MKLTKQEVEKRYKKELEEETINTKNKSYYNGLNQYTKMLIDSGFEVENET